MPKCAFLSIANTQGWFIDDDLVHAPLKKLGWSIRNIPWDEPADWNDFDLVIIRSPWDYQDHLEQFLKVLEDIDQSTATLLNSLRIVKWNIDKSYLFELESKGVELVPTIKRYGLTQTDLDRAFEKFGAEVLVVKPIIGANADDTFRVAKNDSAAYQEVESIFQDRACMIQPFMQHIIEEGEYSLMYFNGKLSHTILKTAGPGDYRVQEEHGGGVKGIKNPEKQLLASAEKAMSALPETPFYARADLVRTPANSFALMELELVEPSLYFRFNSESAAVFAACIDNFWKSRKIVSGKV